MDAQILIAKLQKQREFWCDLGDGKRVRARRPPEVEVGGIVRGVTVEHAMRYAVGWEGFNEDTILGNGAKDQTVDFHPALWGELVSDRTDWLTEFANGLVKACNSHHEQRVAALGNLPPTSTD